jgi:hypothetical protein
MADTNNKKQESAEEKLKPLETTEAPKRSEGKEVKEATISVGIEAGEIIEGAEVPSGRVSETEAKGKEGYAGGRAGGAYGKTAAGARKFKYPPVRKMSHQVEKELSRQMKNLNKKIKRVVKEKDANSLNLLVARLRELKRLLSKLASATSDMIKDMWIAYVKENKK